MELRRRKILALALAAALAGPLMSCNENARAPEAVQAAPVAQTRGASLIPTDQGASVAKHFDPLVVRAMSTEQWLDFVAISIDPKKADGLKFTINRVTSDNGERFVVEMINATLTTIMGFQASKPDLTVRVDRAQLNRVMVG